MVWIWWNDHCLGFFDAWISTIRKRSSSEKAEKGKEAKEKEKEKGGRKARSRPLAWNTNMTSKHGRLEDDVPLCNGTCCRLHLSFWRCVTWYFYFCPGDRLPAIMSFHGSWPVIVLSIQDLTVAVKNLSLSICIYYIWIFICIDIYM